MMSVGPRKCHRGNLHETKDAVNRNEIVLDIRFIPTRYLPVRTEIPRDGEIIYTMVELRGFSMHPRCTVAIGDRRQTVLPPPPSSRHLSFRRYNLEICYNNIILNAMLDM